MVVMRNNERNTAAAAEQHVYTHNRGILLETGDVKHPIHIIPRNGYNTLRQLKGLTHNPGKIDTLTFIDPTTTAIKTDRYGFPLNYGNYKNGRLVTKKEPSRCSEVSHLMVGPFGINCRTVSVSTKADPTPFIEVAPTVATNVNLMSLQEVKLAVNELISVEKQSPGDSTPNIHIPPPTVDLESPPHHPLLQPVADTQSNMPESSPNEHVDNSFVTRHVWLNTVSCISNSLAFSNAALAFAYQSRQFDTGISEKRGENYHTMEREVLLNGYINNDRGQKKGDSSDDTTQLRPPTAPKVDPPISRRFLKHEFTFDSVPTLVTRHDSDSSDDEYESDSVGSMPSLVDREEFDSSDDESDDGGIIVGDGADHVYLFGNRIDYGSRRQQIVDRGANGGLHDNSELHMENIAPIHGDVAYEQAGSPEETAWAATWRSAFSAELDESIRRQDAPYETLLCSSGDHGKRTTGEHTIHPAMQPRDEGNRSDKVVGDQGYSTHDVYMCAQTCINDSATTTPFCPSYKALVPDIIIFLPSALYAAVWLATSTSFLLEPLLGLMYYPRAIAGSTDPPWGDIKRDQAGESHAIVIVGAAMTVIRRAVTHEWTEILKQVILQVAHNECYAMKWMLSLWIEIYAGCPDFGNVSILSADYECKVIGIDDSYGWKMNGKTELSTSESKEIDHYEWDGETELSISASKEYADNTTPCINIMLSMTYAVFVSSNSLNNRRCWNVTIGNGYATTVADSRASDSQVHTHSNAPIKWSSCAHKWGAIHEGHPEVVAVENNFVQRRGAVYLHVHSWGDGEAHPTVMIQHELIVPSRHERLIVASIDRAVDTFPLHSPGPGLISIVVSDISATMSAVEGSGLDPSTACEDDEYMVMPSHTHTMSIVVDYTRVTVTATVSSELTTDATYYRGNLTDSRNLVNGTAPPRIDHAEYFDERDRLASERHDHDIAWMNADRLIDDARRPLQWGAMQGSFPYHNVSITTVIGDDLIRYVDDVLVSDTVLLRRTSKYGEQVATVVQPSHLHVEMLSSEGMHRVKKVKKKVPVAWESGERTWEPADETFRCDKYELTGLKIWQTDIGNAHLEAKTTEKVFVVAGSEFKSFGLEGHVLIIITSVLGKKKKPRYTTLGKSVRLITYGDANLCHNLLLGKAVIGLLHFINKTPFHWYSKKQSTTETANESVAGRTAIEQLRGNKLILHYLGVPIEGVSILIGDNKTAVNAATLPESCFHKQYLMLCEKDDASDVLTKHWGYQQVWPILRPVLFWKCDTPDVIRKSWKAMKSVLDRLLRR